MKVCPVCQARYGQESLYCRKEGAALVPDRAVAPDVLARRELLERRISQEPENPELFEEFGDLLASIPLYEDALVQLFKALELEPGRERARRKIAEVYRARADWPSAARHLGVLLEAHPADPELLAALADVYEKAGRRAEAADLFGRLAELAPGDLPVWLHWRDLLLQTRRDGALLPVYRRLVELEPEALSHWLELSARLLADDEGTLEEWGRIDARLSRAVQAGEVSGGQRGAYAGLYLAVARLRLGTATPDARHLLRDAEPHSLDAGSTALAADCLAALGELALGQGLEEDACDAFGLALRFQATPRARAGLATIHGTRAAALLARKRFREAVAECDRGLSQVPDDAGLRATRRLAVRGRRLRAGLAAACAAVVLAGAFFWFFARGGRVGQAPSPENLLSSFAGLLEGQEGTRDFRRAAGGRELTFLLGNDQWRVTAERARVEPLDDDTGAYRGTLDTRWEKNGAAVLTRRGLPPGLQKLGVGPRASEARYNRHNKRWKW